jgi:hypothetical protein
MTQGSPLPEEMRRFAASVAAREILREAAAVLGRQQIAVIPLKGVFFQRVLYADPAQRFSSDVDLLVLPEQFQRAAAALLAAGFRSQKVGRSLIEAAFSSPRGLAVDLHCQLFGPGRFRLSAQAVFERARPDEQLFGVPLLVADPYDMAAHLIGKLVTDHVSADAQQRIAELLLLIDRYGLEPERLARHAGACGLGRAARYVLDLGARQSLHRDYFGAALASLPADPVGQLCVWAARTTLARARSPAIGSLVAHSLNSSLPRGAASAGMAALNRLRHARLERARRASGGQWVPFRAA